MINEDFLKGLIGKRVSIAVKNLPRVSGGVLVTVDEGCVCLDTKRVNDRDPQKVYISVDQIASVLVY